MDTKQRRHREVAATIDAVKRICGSGEAVDRSMLARIEAELKKLAAQTDLFPEDEFGISPDETIKLFRLAEDDDNRFALYYHCANAPAAVDPHNHTTWACIAGISGVEENTLYELKDGVPVAKGTTEIRAESSISLLPDDVHSIAARGSEPFANLHLYGFAIDKLHDRVFWNAEDRRWETSSPITGIVERRP